MGKRRRKKYWSYSAGERGRNRIRVFEDAKSKSVLIEFYAPDPVTGALRRKRKSLGHGDRTKAKQAADQIAVQIAKAGPPSRGPLTVGGLFEKFLCEMTPSKVATGRRHDARCATMFGDFLGRGRKVKSIDCSDVARFVRDRRAGGIRPAGSRGTGGVGDRTIGRDLEWLRAVLKWGCLLKDENGESLLRENPLTGMEIPKEESPNRPVVTEDRFAEMLAVADAIGWQFRLALILAHETGHRIGAIRRLRWSDIDFSEELIRWRKENDKIGFKHSTYLTPVAVTALEKVRREVPGIGEAWVFPAPRDPNKPCSKDLMRAWWLRAERFAVLRHVQGLGWHGLRRKFAIELKDTPLIDLGILGGWKRPETILEVYQRPDRETQQRALRARRAIKIAND